ncbi:MULTISPECIES: glycosyltransferase [unclassified Yoonia]|uniref:MraY family glycosyltransferase n=1 Tax=unclassified Yoonia TaxID=2629118 RepID=UPI002AFF5362|nr:MULTISPECIES: glycosyltransferase [unclassified Yoonia]
MIFITALIVTTVAGMFIVRLRPLLFLPNAVARNDLRARQASHIGEPLRLGGIAVFIGLGIGVMFAPLGGDRGLILLILLSVMPVLLAGFAEDMGYRISPTRRLIAAVVSALVAVVLLNLWVPRADLPVIDWIMSSPIIAIALTILLSGGFCHAVNLIDGTNGFAAVNMIMSATGLALIAKFSGETAIATFAWLIVACLAGFLVLNWPVASLFLGDGGAYGIGHVVIWVAIVLVARVDDLAVPALLLILFWPLADVFHTIVRRLIGRQPAFQPDRMHLHHKVRRGLDLAFFGYNARSKSNPRTIVVLAPFMAVPVIAGVVLSSQPHFAWGALAVCLCAFALAHRMASKLARRYRKDNRHFAHLK